MAVDDNGDFGNLTIDLSAFTPDLQEATAKPECEPVAISCRTLDNVAFHDFAFHEYVLPTETGFTVHSDISDRGQEYLDELAQAGVPQDQISLLEYFLGEVEKNVRVYLSHGNVRWLPLQDRLALINGVIETLYDHFEYFLLLMFTEFETERLSGRGQAYLVFLRDLFAIVLRFAAVGNGSLSSARTGGPDFMRFWTNTGILFDDFFRSYRSGDPSNFIVNNITQELVETPDLFAEYPFEVFPDRSVNVGLRLVYRQEWRPLGAQPGEIVRTIPLGPGQKERVTSKIIRRQKRTTSMETVTATETSTETTDSTKDSSEIVSEAADTFKWNVDAKASASFGFASASVESSLGGSSEDKSKRTSSQLSETMQKMASKIRRETKVIVNTESEITTELENVSEISNPNNEMAITYEYHKLQQQYEVFTYLAEAQSVVFVSESVPTPAEVDEYWVRKHDWIIAKVLKDESHRATLNELIQDIDDEDPLGGVGNNPFRMMLDTANSQFAKFNQTAGAASAAATPTGPSLSIPDIYGEPQRIYQESLRENAARVRSNTIRGIKRKRFFRHIRDNILYYCRAIWAHEDGDQRLLRYKKEGRQIPIEWDAPFAVTSTTGGSQARGQFTPTGKSAPLWEMVDPTGPLGYAGNYAVFALRPTGDDEPQRYKLDLEQALKNGRMIFTLKQLFSLLRGPYVRRDMLHDPALKTYEDTAQLMTDDELKTLDDHAVRDIASYLPRITDGLFQDPLGAQIKRNPDKTLINPVSRDDYAEYLYRKNGTRRFLVDSNNLYLGIRIGSGAALEPFKRAHRYIDVLKANQELVGLALKNERRSRNVDNPDLFDPDIEKVVIVGDHADSHEIAMNAALVGSERSTPPPPALQPVGAADAGG